MYLPFDFTICQENFLGVSSAIASNVRTMSKNDKRKHIRMGLNVDVELIISEQQVVKTKSIDVSDGGVFLQADESQMPPNGTEVKIRVTGQIGGGEEPPFVHALIVRRNAQGVGLEFINE